MKNLIYILLAIVLLGTIGCRKKDEGFMLTGRILKDCNGEPLANFPLEAIVSTRRIVKATDYYYFDTDANGYINLMIEEFGAVELRAAAGATLLSDISGPSNKKELNLGTFMKSPSTSFVYRIKVNNPYNVGDTLVLNVDGLLTLANANKPLHSIAAPLSDTTFEVVTNYRERGFPSFSNINKVNVKMEYGVANSNRELYFEKNNLVFPMDACNAKIDTITLIVD